MTTTTVAIIFGGANSEHEVSCKSAASVLEHLDRERYTPVLIGIAKDGTWHRVEAIEDLGTGSDAELFDGFTGFSGIDVAIPVLHGRFGEDGTVQGLLELSGVRYVGSGVLSSALCMDKAMCQRVLAAAGLPVVPTGVVTPASRGEAESVAASFGYPVFVKPNRSGSSVGVSRVDVPSDLDEALDSAFANDTTVLIQPLVDAAEVDVGVIEYPDGSLAVGAPLGVHLAQSSSFFDYSAKYVAGGVTFEVPAKIDDAVRDDLGDLAMQAFRALSCAGLARVDFFVHDDGAISINEVNTFPGMTALSQYPRIWAAAGVSYPQLLDIFIERALAPESFATTSTIV